MIGGILGVLYSVPLRRNMILEDNLPYPEGLATGELLKAGEETDQTQKEVKPQPRATVPHNLSGQRPVLVTPSAP